MMGHKVAMMRFGTPQEIMEKIYQSAKAAMDFGNYAFAALFFMVLNENDYKDSKDLMSVARSKNRHDLGIGDYLNLGKRKWNSNVEYVPMAWKVVDSLLLKQF